jgi:hypothetical protein
MKFGGSYIVPFALAFPLVTASRTQQERNGHHFRGK